MIITIAGKPGSGKSSVAKMLAKKLGYKVFSAGDLRGEIAMKHKITIDQLNEIGKKEKWTDEECDKLLEKMGKKEDNIVFDSWMAWHFIPKSVKIFLDADMKESAKRIFKKQRPDEAKQKTVDGVYKMISKRFKESVARYKKWYDVDMLDMKKYDLVIDTTDKTKEQVLAIITKFLESFKNHSL